MAGLSLPSIGSINESSDEKDLKTATDLLFETTPYLLKKLSDKKPFDCYNDLIDKAKGIIRVASDSEKCEILSAHPRIGQTTALSSLSASEQGQSNSTSDAPEILEELRLLNEQYEERFNFKFVVFVNGRSRSEIIPVFKQRLTKKREEEMEAGLVAMIDIAYSRLEKLQNS